MAFILCWFMVSFRRSHAQISILLGVNLGFWETAHLPLP